MPVMDGLQLLHCLHEQQLQCDVIFISGFDDYSFVREAMKSGAVDYLLKPIAEDELYAQIDGFLKRAALRVPIHTARIRPEENVYLQQYVLDKLFDGTDAIPDSVLAELHLPPAALAALLAAPGDFQRGRSAVVRTGASDPSAPSGGGLHPVSGPQKADVPEPVPFFQPGAV